MTKRDVIALTSKVLGFFTVVSVAWFLADVVSWVEFTSSGNVQGAMLEMWLGVAVSLSLQGLTAWFLIWKADRIGSWLYAEEEPQATVVSLDKEALLQVALIGIGVFLVSRALTGIPEMVFLIRSRTPYDSANAWSACLRVVLEAAIGLYLALGTRGLMRAIEYFRQKGSA